MEAYPHRLSFCPLESKFSHLPLPDMPIMGSSNSAASKDMVSKIWINGDTIL